MCMHTCGHHRMVTRRETNFQARFFYNTFLLISKPTHRYNFSLLASLSFMERFCANEHVCLDMHRFSSIDNWLRDN